MRLLCARFVRMFASVRFFCRSMPLLFHSRCVSVIKLSARIMTLCVAWTVDSRWREFSAVRYRVRDAHRHKGDQRYTNNRMKLDFMTISNRFLGTSTFCALSCTKSNCQFSIGQRGFLPSTQLLLILQVTFLRCLHVNVQPWPIFQSLHAMANLPSTLERMLVIIYLECSDRV